MTTVYYLKLDAFFDDYFPELAEITPQDLKKRLEKDGGVWYSEEGTYLTVYNDVTDVIPILADTTFDFFKFSNPHNKPLMFSINGIVHSVNENFVKFIVDVLKKEGA